MRSAPVPTKIAKCNKNLRDPAHVRAFCGAQQVMSSMFLVALTVCMSLYGTFGMAAQGSGSGIFSMELCINGRVQTVLVGEDGEPVEPAQTCSDCIVCNAVSATLLATNFDAPISVNFKKLQIKRDDAQGQVLGKRNILPVPRGPPLKQIQINTCDQTKSNWRPEAGGTAA